MPSTADFPSSTGPRILIRALRRATTGFALGFMVACGGGGGGTSPLTPNSVDLTVDAEALARTLSFVNAFIDVDDCAYIEGLVDTPGIRRLLRFSTIVINYGALDLVVGSPANPLPPLTAADFELSPCHGHYHFEGWADYSLEDSTGTVVGFGHKQAFCLLDSLSYYGIAPEGRFDCDFQGISAGYGDSYPAGIDGQWVDITGLPAGSYTLVVSVNVAGKIVEADDRYPNTVRVPVVIP